MRIVLLAILSWAFSISQIQASPERYASGIPSLDAFLTFNQTSNSQEVVGMTGFYGQEQPKQWLILTRDKDSPDSMTEFVVSGKTVQAKRQVRRLPNQDLPGIALNRSRLKVDSNVAFKIVESLAKDRKVGYDSVHYQLRCRDLNTEPVWMINLLDLAGKSIGIHYISAESSAILRSVWHQSSLQSLTRVSDGKNVKPVSLLYGGTVKELTLSGNAGRQKRTIKRVIEPAPVK